MEDSVEHTHVGLQSSLVLLDLTWHPILAQDGVKLAQALAAAGGLEAPPHALADALRGYERERSARAAPVIKKSYTMGTMLQIQNPIVSFRDIHPPVHACCPPA